MKKILLLSILIGLSFSGCKKDSSSSGGSVGNIPYSQPTYSNVYGTFFASRQSWPTNTYFYADAVFYSQPKSTLWDTLNTTKVGYLKFNNTAMMVDSFGSGGPYQYSDTLMGNVYYPLSTQWDVGGLGSIPGFSTQPVLFPYFSSMNNLPDTISKSLYITLNTTGIIGADYLHVSIYPDSGPIYLSPPYKVTSSYIISPTNLSSINANQGASLAFILYKTTTNNYSGKNFVSQLESICTKRVYITN